MFPPLSNSNHVLLPSPAGTGHIFNSLSGRGLGAGFVPSILNVGALDGVITVGKDEAYNYAQRLAKEEGIMAGVSTGAALAAVSKRLPEMEKGSRILTYNYDTGERYLSIEGFFA